MRIVFLRFSFLLIVAIGVAGLFWVPILWSFVVIGPLILVGIVDMRQPSHTIKRNFPLLGRMRYWMEALRPKIYQYFIESDTDGTPFNRLNRNVIYQRSKKVNDTTPFGTQLNVYEVGYEWLNHSITPLDSHKLNHDPRVTVGGPDCKQPYSASIYNISAMSYGSLSQNAILSLNSGAKIGGFAHNTGEGGLSPYHLAPGGDIIWQIGTGYFGCRNKDGTFNFDLFKERAVLPNVKMIEIKLSQGAKPGHGGILPAKKVTEEIAKIRLVEMGQDVISPPFHSAFGTPIEMLNFIKRLRELSDGKPIGFKLCVGMKSQFLALCKAMVKTGITPDFITVDGGEGGTGAAPLEFSNSVGMPLRDGLAFIHDALNGFSLRRHIRIIASGKVATGFDIVKLLALGADMCNSARAMMLAVGCIQALECNTNRCPTGVATQDKSLQKGLVVEDKKVRVANFHAETVKSAIELLGAAGISEPSKIHRSFIYRRVSAGEIKTYAETYPYILRGSLLEAPYPEQYQYDLSNCNEETFEPLIKR
ncbi:MAG TPA: FMN-binding glutamate synthase family protein [Bacteroidia bacterium]|jgi:glutamate synthase domain-containing protein 2|nr:FMN-binding glutamate synthase family protein [Bacteroidia bacterium]